ncbi:MAG: hypothetical protein CSB48_09255 [Proteobacteria bacterium]|nr:MAG: hypothetical protein CSB48_09255 [Pseudomonadota bacterium]
MVKKNFYRCLRIGLLSLVALFSLNSMAGFIETRPHEDTVSLGSQATVDVYFSDASSLVRSFDFLVSFDSDILSIASVTFGDQFGGALDVFRDVSFGADFVNVSEMSFLSDLASVQTTLDIFLASITFDAMSLGISALSLAGQDYNSGNILFDELGSAIGLDIVKTGFINVISASVPEAPMTGLLAIALCAFMTQRKKRTES